MGWLSERSTSSPQVYRGVGDKTVTLKKVPIYVSGAGTDTDDQYGNLGQDAVANFDSFTPDFARMSFRLGEPLAADKAH